MMTKKLVGILSALAIIATLAVGTTLALLISLAGPVENVFTIGNVNITLTETTGGSYQMIPGTSIPKNPHVTVKGGSESCWLFVSVEKSQYFADYLSFELEDGWQQLEEYSGIYYRSVYAAMYDVGYYVIKDNAVLVSSALTEEKMNEISSLPTLTIKAYAIQSHGVESALDGWLRLQEEAAR